MPQQHLTNVLNSGWFFRFAACLLLLSATRAAFAIEANKPQLTLADTIQQSQIPREQFYGEVKLLHSPFPIDIQFSDDGSVLFSLAETVRLWRSDTGAYLGSISGPEKFSKFALFNKSRQMITLDRIGADDHGLYYGVPQNLPHLRVWDLTTGKCLAIRRLKIPVNAYKIRVSSLVSAQYQQMTYVILEYESDEERGLSLTYPLLLGFHGQNLTPVFRVEFDYYIESLNWDSRTRQLHLYAANSVAGFDPVSKEILWKKSLDQHNMQAIPDEVSGSISLPTNDQNGIDELRYKSAVQRWYIFDKTLPGREKIIWSKAANRACHIGGEFEEINLFNTKTRKRVAPVTGMVNALSTLSENKFASASDYHDVSVFQLETPDRIHRLFHTEVPENSCVAISRDATMLLTGTTSGKAYLWNLTQDQKRFKLTGVPKEVLCIAADTSQNKIAACDLNGDFWYWNLPVSSTEATETSRHLIAKQNKRPAKSRYPNDLSHAELTNSLCSFSPDGKLALCYQTLEFKDPPLFPVKEEDTFPSPGFQLVAKLNDERVYGEVIVTENTESQRILTPAIGRHDVLIQIKSTPDGRFALFVFSTGQITIIDLQTKTLESIIQTNDLEIVDVDFHSDQHTLLVASYRGAVTAWNTETFLKTGSLQLYDSRLNFLSSRVAKQGFDLILGTRDTGLIVKHGVFPAAERQGQKPPALYIPFNPDNQ